MQKTLNFQAYETVYNRHLEENVAMIRRLKERKPVLSRKEWSKFGEEQKVYSLNARNPDQTAGHLPKATKRSAGKKSLVGLKTTQTPMTPSG